MLRNGGLLCLGLIQFRQHIPAQKFWFRSAKLGNKNPQGLRLGIFVGKMNK